MKTGFTTSALYVLMILFVHSCEGQKPTEEWAEWMGKDQLSTWDLDLEKESLAQDDLQKKWEVKIGTGYSGPTLSKGKVYVMDYLKQNERVLCYDAESGKKHWIYSYETDYSIGYPTGPRASVILDEGLAYSFGTMGDLHCFDAASGKVKWHIKGNESYNIDMPIWGLAASPKIVGNLVITQMGGRPDACLVAFNKKTGKEAWKILDDNASYSSPILIDQNGKEVLVCWTGDNLVGLNPINGQTYWKLPYHRKKEVINISTPIYQPPYIFLSSFYDGSMLVELDATALKVQKIWERTGESERKTDALHCIISTPFFQGEYVYGVDSYGEFRCLDLATGDRIWTDSTLVPYGRWANAHFVKQEDKIWAFNEKGELILGKVSPEKFTELGRANLIQPVKVSPNPRGGVNWAFPAFAGRKIYARSDGALVCYELIK